jgi:hypothetical protein
MTNTLCLLYGAFQAFLLFWLADSVAHRKRLSPERFHGGQNEKQKSNIVPLQFIGPTLIVFWSYGTWDRFLSTEDRSEPVARRGESAMNKKFGVAA